MKAYVIFGFILLLSLVSALRAEDKDTANAVSLSVDQQLILACYQLDEVQVQKLLNSGADVNSKYLSKNFKELFRDRWTEGAVQIVVCSGDAGLAMCRQYFATRIPRLQYHRSDTRPFFADSHSQTVAAQCAQSSLYVCAQNRQ